MNCVATWSFEPWFQSEGNPWSSTVDMLAAARASIELVAKNYSRPTIYTDSFSSKILGQITNKANFEVVYDGFYENYPPSLWALTKVKTYSKQQEPYFHFDLDFLCLKPFPQNKFECDVMFQCYEDLNELGEVTLSFYNLPVVSEYYNLPSIMMQKNPNNIHGANLGCLFMNNMELNKAYTDLVNELVENNIDVFRRGPVLGMCVVEQHTLGMILNESRYKVETIKKSSFHAPPFDDYFIHFIGANYKTNVYSSAKKIRAHYLNYWINSDIVLLADELDTMKRNFNNGPT